MTDLIDDESAHKCKRQNQNAEDNTVDVIMQNMMGECHHSTHTGESLHHIEEYDTHEVPVQTLCQQDLHVLEVVVLDDFDVLFDFIIIVCLLDFGENVFRFHVVINVDVVIWRFKQEETRDEKYYWHCQVQIGEHFVTDNGSNSKLHQVCGVQEERQHCEANTSNVGIQDLANISWHNGVCNSHVQTKQEPGEVEVIELLCEADYDPSYGGQDT